VTQGEDLGYDVVDAFVGYHGIANVESVRDAYRGHYDSGADFAEEYYNDIYGDVPSFLVVDWEATWNQSLYYDFDFVDGYVFDSNF
jgi:antirestriction protein